MSEKKMNIPPKIGWYLAGFADGEGSFNVSLRGRGVSLSFNISRDEKVILALFKRYLGCGTLRMGKDGTWHYEVTNVNALSEKVVPFFKKFHFLSQKKKKTFSKFKKVLEMVLNGEHLTEDGIKKIAKLREEINGDHPKRKYSSLEESSETIR